MKLVRIFVPILLISTVVIYVGYRYSKSKTNRTVSPTAVRSWVQPSQAFEGDLAADFPILKPDESPDLAVLTEQSSNEVKFNHLLGYSSSLLYGDRACADANQIVTLSSGVKVQMIAFATTPKTHITDSPKRSEKEFLIDWFDSQTLEQIEIDELPSNGILINDQHSLLLAFKIINSDGSDPIIWHDPSVRHHQSKIGFSFWRTFAISLQETIQIYVVDRPFFHDSKIDIVIPISHGGRQTLEIDLEKVSDNQPIYFSSKKEVSITPLFTQPGSINGWGSGGKSVFSSYSWSPGNGKLFSLLQVNPPEWLGQIRSNNTDTVPIAYPHNSILEANEINIEDQIIRIECLKNRTHCHFILQALPQLPVVDDLLSVDIGPILIKGYSHLVEVIQGATGLDIDDDLWKGDRINPVFYQSVTPNELIQELGKSRPVEIDYENFQIKKKTPSKRFRF